MRRKIKMERVHVSILSIASAIILGFVSTTAIAQNESANSRPVQKLAPANTAPAQSPAAQRASGDEKYTFNFNQADLEAVVKTVAKMTGKNFLLDPRAKGKITIVSATPVSKYAAYQIFLSALKAQGFTAVPGTGGIIKIVPVGEGKQSGQSPSSGLPRGGDQIVTHIVTIQNGSANKLIPLLRPLMAPTSQLSAYEPSNSLIITDYAENIRRLLRIVAQVDQPLDVEVTVIPLKYASALDISDLISRTMSQRNVPAVKRPGEQLPGLSIVPDLRTNSLLVRSSNPGQLKQLQNLVRKLDVVATQSGRTHVVYLRNSEAPKLVEVLRGLLEAETQKPTNAKGSKSTTRKSLIQADEATNSLIINAPDAVYNNLRAVIEKLDIRRAQVYVEALIAEVTSDKASALGFQWAAATDSGGNLIGATSNFPAAGAGSIGSVAADPTGLANVPGLSIAMLGPETVIGGKPVRSIAGLAHALEEDTNANILSTPNLLTLDNTEAKIIVGQNVPFVTGSYASTNGTSTANPFQTIERKDVGLTLKIKPQISEGGLVRLSIYQEVSSVLPTTTSGASDLITNKRSLETTVTVDNGHTIVLGGLIEDKLQNVAQKVKVLGSIPLLGALFRYKKKSKVKTNLMVFLKPTILYNASDSFNVTRGRYEYLMQRNQKASDERKTTLDSFAPVPVKPEAKARPEIPTDTAKMPTNTPEKPSDTEDNSAPEGADNASPGQ